MQIAHSCSSRDGGAFAGALSTHFDGDRSHTVLNSLSLDLTAASLATLSEDGAFEEIGKRGTWTLARHAASRPTTSYCAIALDTDISHRPCWMRSVLWLLSARVCTGMARGCHCSASTCAHVRSWHLFAIQHCGNGRSLSTPSGRSWAVQPRHGWRRRHSATAGHHPPYQSDSNYNQILNWITSD